MSPTISVLRLGHRIYRDRRITTHCCLVARAFGASKIYIQGDENDKIVKTMEDITKRLGGSFVVEHITKWRSLIRNWKGDVIHLTQKAVMDIDKSLGVLKSSRDKLIVVGGKKVPSDLYKLVTYNISVTREPHSEISALAICLDRLKGNRKA